MVRWCMGPDVIQRAIKEAARKAGIPGKVTPHCLRHSFCSDLLDSGHNPRRVQEAMGHTDIRTTMGYARKECLSLPSPIQTLKLRTA
jgi:site-specific recombinase XerD